MAERPALAHATWKGMLMLKSIPALFCAAGVALPLPAAAQQPVRTTGGPVLGVPAANGSVVSYKGIPYAAAPVGELRWRAPQPPAPWTEVRKADQFGSSCIQNIVEERKPWTHEFMAHNAISEECLSLNVWTPARTPDAKRPVYFWIHGGGYVEGSSAVPVYDGENLAKRGVVVVTINYRLGVFGFLAHPELTKEAGRSGNYGSLDQVAALEWVQKNIAAFGGDPNNVTISGQSAGASGVHNLVASPLAKGLFHRAIAQSGSGYAPTNPSLGLSDAEKKGVAFAEAKGAASLKDLRAMPAEKLMARISDGPGSTFRPVVDDYFLTADPIAIYAQGKQNDVPELTGMNLDERSSTQRLRNHPDGAVREDHEGPLRRPGGDVLRAVPQQHAGAVGRVPESRVSRRGPPFHAHVGRSTARIRPGTTPSRTTGRTRCRVQTARATAHSTRRKSPTCSTRSTSRPGRGATRIASSPT